MTRDRCRDFVCPRCHQELSLRQEVLACGACRSEYPVIADVPCFTGGTSQWRFSTEVALPEILTLAKEKGWRHSLSAMDKKRSDWVLGEDRFTLSLMSSPKGRVLDCGSGWGGLTFWLTKEFDHVYALDSELHGLQFIDIRAEQEGIRHLTTVQGDVLSMPFSDDYFDVVVLNGVLEWVGTFSKQAPPQTLQESALKEIARVLKPEGTLFLAIENRYGLQYFLGYKEEHTGLRFISLLPRFLANLYHRARRGEELRALTHSRFGLKRMLEKSGFSASKWFFTYPSYRNCRYAASLDGSGGMRFLSRNYLAGERASDTRLRRLLAATLLSVRPLMKLGSCFSPAWIVFASHRVAPRLGLHSQYGLMDMAGSQEDLAVAINPRRASFFEVQRQDAELVGKYSVPLSDRALQKTKMSYACVKFLLQAEPQLEQNLPDICLRASRMSLVEYSKAVSGTPLRFDDVPGLRSFMDVLLRLGLAEIPPSGLSEIFQEFDVRDTFTQWAREQNLGDDLQEILRRAQIIHGDLNTGNIFVNREEPSCPTLLDFEHAMIGPNVLNWYDFLLRNLVIAGDRLPIRTETAVSRFRKLPGSEDAMPRLNDMTREFLEGCQVPAVHHHALLRLYMHHLCFDPIVDNRDEALAALAAMEVRL